MTETNVYDTFAIAMEAFAQKTPINRLGLAVSGGGDSLALLLLAKRWAQKVGVQLSVVTIDHGLRPESAGEARFVGQTARSLGISHNIITLKNWRGAGNLQKTARDARYEALCAWQDPAPFIALGHTLEDQAETFLMRLKRGSGVDGLAGMPDRRVIAPGREILRPLLGCTRAALRAYLRAQNIGWIDDPSNENRAFERVRMRQALAELKLIGLEAESLAKASNAMRRAQNALEARARECASRIAHVNQGDVLFATPQLWEIEEETRLRLVSCALQWISVSPYRPRLQALQDAMQAAQSGRRHSLGGVLFLPQKGQLALVREHAAQPTEQQMLGADQPVLWDGRWVVSTKLSGVFELRSLGEEARRNNLDFLIQDQLWQSLVAVPAVFSNGKLLASPALRTSNSDFFFSLMPQTPWHSAAED